MDLSLGLVLRWIDPHCKPANPTGPSSCKEQSMTQINTLVYLDLEATGLKKSGRPRITEISLVAINTQDIISLQGHILSYLQKERNQTNWMQVETILPRMINKLTLSVYPMATIMPEVTRITGLDNYNLTGQARFDNHLGDMINAFLARLPSPVCLVAHNGQMYDFPLLKSEMRQAGSNLESSILYADSLIGIKEIFSERKMSRRKIAHMKQMKWLEERKIIQEEKLAATEILLSGEFDIDMLAGNKTNQERETSYLLFKHANEMTPKKCNYKVLEPQAPKKLNQNLVKQEKKQKVLFPDNTGTPKSFSLTNLHSHFLGSLPTKSHGAEDDCLALIRTTAMLGQDWINWVEKNCQSFQHCEEMWGKIEK